MGFNLIFAVISVSTVPHHAKDKTPAPAAGALRGFTGQLLPVTLGVWLADAPKLSSCPSRHPRGTSGLCVFAKWLLFA